MIDPTQAPLPGLLPVEPPVEAPQVEQIDEAAIVRDVNDMLAKGRTDRRPYEHEWMLSAACLRSKGKAKTDPILGTLIKDKVPAHRRFLSINLVWGKFNAKIAKLINSRPRPIVAPASRDRSDVLDARFSQQWMLYTRRKSGLESKYEIACAQAEITGKSFLWAWWDPNALATIKNPQTGETIDAPEGDVDVSVGSAFEMIVDDLGQPVIGRQKRIMRVTAVLISDVRVQFKDKLHGVEIQSDVAQDDLFQFERQIATLGTAGALGFSASQGNTLNKDNNKLYCLKKEMFVAPTLTKPQGCYAVVVGDTLCRYQETLPYGFATIKDNPYPVEEISSDLAPMQFWPQTMIERLRALQDIFDTIVSKLMEDLDLAMHGKWLIPKAARIPTNAFNSEGGEKVYYNYFPGMPPPQLVQPRGVSADAWRMLDRVIDWYDRVTNIWPSSVGQVGDAKSGFQSTVMQEAADAVYGPHKQRNERALAGLYFKLRRMAKKGYDIPRLISIGGKGSVASAFEFSQDQINEHTEITVQIGSALSDSKVARLQQVLELAGSGIMGDQNAPATRRAALSLVDLGGVEEQIDPTYPDQERARNENETVTQGGKLAPPAPWHTDSIHVELHFEQLNSPEFDTWTEEQKIELMGHTALHLRKHNPNLGLEIAYAVGDQQLIQVLQEAVTAAMPVAPAAEQEPPLAA